MRIPPGHRSSLYLHEPSHLVPSHPLLLWQAAYSRFSKLVEKTDLLQQSGSDLRRARRAWAASVDDDCTSRLYFTELRESPKQREYRIRESALAKALLSAYMGSKKLAPLYADNNWYIFLGEKGQSNALDVPGPFRLLEDEPELVSYPHPNCPPKQSKQAVERQKILIYEPPYGQVLREETTALRRG